MYRLCREVYGVWSVERTVYCMVCEKVSVLYICGEEGCTLHGLWRKMYTVWSVRRIVFFMLCEEEGFTLEGLRRRLYFTGAVEMRAVCCIL